MTIAEMMNNTLTNHIFPATYDFYLDDEQLKKAFEEKFIRHYYYREIGFESPFMFIQKLESHLILNMPYWKQLYQTELESRDINFLLNKDLTETFSREINSENQTSGTNNSTQNATNTSSITQNGTSSSTNSTTENGTNESIHKESSINNGVSEVALSDGYLTGTSSDDGSHSTTTSNTASGENETKGTSTSTDEVESSGTTTQTGNENMTETTELVSKGNIGITSSAQLLKEWREVLINMDKIIIESCNDLFLKIY